MKTTIELSDDLLLAAKRLALERRTTLRALVENGLRRELAGDEDTAPRHPLEDVVSLDPAPWKGLEADEFVTAERARWE